MSGPSSKGRAEGRGGRTPETWGQALELSTGLHRLLTWVASSSSRARRLPTSSAVRARRPRRPVIAEGSTNAIANHSKTVRGEKTIAQASTRLKAHSARSLVMACPFPPPRKGVSHLEGIPVGKWIPTLSKRREYPQRGRDACTDASVSSRGRGPQNDADELVAEGVYRSPPP